MSVVNPPYDGPKREAVGERVEVEHLPCGGIRFGGEKQSEQHTCGDDEHDNNNRTDKRTCGIPKPPHLSTSEGDSVHTCGECEEVNLLNMECHIDHEFKEAWQLACEHFKERKDDQRD